MKTFWEYLHNEEIAPIEANPSPSDRHLLFPHRSLQLKALDQSQNLGKLRKMKL
jgi:hypothetical protein